MKETAIPFLVLMLLALPGVDQASENHHAWSAAEREIWALETEYMTHFKEENSDGMAAFYHQDFLGWPSHSAEPVGSFEGRASVERLLQNLEITDLDLRPRAIHHEGGLAVVHYFVVLTLVGDGGAPETAAFRLTHTWIKENGVWKILGGMSARADIEQ